MEMKLERQRTPSDMVWREFSIQKKKANFDLGKIWANPSECLINKGFSW